MSTRAERRKQIRKAGVKPKTLKDWKLEYDKLPAEIKMILSANMTNNVVPEAYYNKAKETYPQYWDEDGHFTPIKWN